MFAAVSLFTQAAAAIQKAGGWFESAYAEFSLGDYESFNAYVAKEGSGFVKLDAELVRSYGSYGRVDAIGLSAGKYRLKIVPVVDGAEQESASATTTDLTVKAYDRTGYAHFGHSGGVGAYNNDGTLKSGARVLYVNRANLKTVTLDMKVSSGGATEQRTGLQHILQAYESGEEDRPLAVRILGKLELAALDSIGSKEEGLQIKSRTGSKEMSLTIEGVGNDAAIYGFGLLLRNCTGVELRNFAVMLCLDDAVSLDTKNKHCWVHNLDLFYGKTGSAADQVKGDGTIDIKALSTNITVAYNHLFDNGKASLCGMKNETTDCYVTYHHNWFDHCDSRMPRVRTMTVHVYNNYFDGISKYGTGATTGSSVFVESNYFRNTQKPMLISMQGSDTNNGTETGTFSGEDGGVIKSYGNKFEGSYKYKPYSATNSKHFDAYEASSRTEQVPAEVKTLQGATGYSNFDTNATLIYSYTSDAAADVPDIVKGEYGAGRMQHGDFSWTFNNSADDNSAAVNADLKAAITDYEATVEKIIGEGYEGVNIDEYEEQQGTDPQPGTGSYECYFTGLKPSSTFYTITGNYSNSKGKAVVNGVTYTDCLKMEGSTSIKFITDKELTLYLVFAESETGNIKINGAKKTSTTNVLTQTLAAGSYELTKGDTRNLFYINLLGDETTGISALTNDDKTYIYFDIMGCRLPSVPEKGLYLKYDGKTAEKVIVY